MIDNEPLAFRMRPQTIEDIVGQDHILAKDKILYFCIYKAPFRQGLCFLIAHHLNFCKKPDRPWWTVRFYVTILLFLDQLIGKVCRARE